MECTLTMDNDSGYGSHHQESNLDSSFEGADRTKKMDNVQDLFLNEDALLEKPERNKNKHYDSFDSVISSSPDADSSKTAFSGFNDSGQSDASFVIPVAAPLVYRISECQEDHHASAEDSSPSTKLSFPLKVLANVTNTYDQNPVQAAFRNAPNDKENVPPPHSLTPKKPSYHNYQSSDMSPDLFGDEESGAEVAVRPKTPPKKNVAKNNKDAKLLRNVQSALGGVHPPPSVTIIQMSVSEMLDKINANKELMWTASSTRTTEVGKSLLLNGTEECLGARWPEILACRYHGLHYNRSKTSEDFEHLCVKYAERCVGVETQSSCTIFDSNSSSSQKRRLSKPRWSKSPGRRLSHLATRRITFSSSNLQASSSSAILGSRTRQILVDARKLNALRKSPRKTPSKSPFKVRKNTPSSSAKKKLAMRFREMSGEFEMMPNTSSDQRGLSFKRALFTGEKNSGPMEKRSTKRALFVSPLKSSPSKKSPLKLSALDRKRKRSDVDIGNVAKQARRSSMDVPSTSKSEPHSFLNRTLSEPLTAARPEELSDQHKKKLQWAVYESLRLQNVLPAHPNYKVFASVLARVTRKFLPNLRFEGRTTEKMFRVARQHAYAVVKGKTVDEIFNEYMRNRAKNQKPQGYVGLEEYNRARENPNKENVDVQNKASAERRREQPVASTRNYSQNRIDKIKKVISFEETS